MDALHSNANDDDDESSGGHKGASVRLVAAFVGASLALAELPRKQSATVSSAPADTLTAKQVTELAHKTTTTTTTTITIYLCPMHATGT